MKALNAAALLTMLVLSACSTAGVASGGSGAVDSPKPVGDKGQLPTIAEKTKGLRQLSGLFVLHVDDAKGRVWLELPPPGERGVMASCLYIEGLTTGLGSNPIGLDRGQLGATRVVDLRRVGSKVLIEQPNLRFRAHTDNDDEIAATRASFATSVLWAADVAAQGPDGSVLLDLTEFIVRDAHGVSSTLARNGQGNWTLDSKRSVLDPSSLLAFPDNLEFEAILTFKGSQPGRDVRSTAPSAKAVTLVQHHSLVRLPDDGYRKRVHDPRSGGMAVSFHDYAAPLAGTIKTAYTVRHRLEKTTPGAAPSGVVEPIVYYVDRGAPSPVREALIEGASWWAQAYEKAGFLDAFRVELLPKGAHALDVRYNVIQWVHRSTRGWSYGGGVTDPRTGEKIKGHVSLGSLRVRQDRLLFEGLAGTAKTGTGSKDDPVQLALARIRQLSAHEVGHTLGLSHNFAASTYGGRASVMDYPAPLLGFKAASGGDGGQELDFSAAYAVGVGVWDDVAISALYAEFDSGADEKALVAAQLDRAQEKGYLYFSDADARSAGSAHPAAALWDNGTDPVESLAQVMAVRRHAMQRFDANNLRPGRPLAELQEVFAPLYLHHRYQLEAAVKVVGGMEWTHQLRGESNVQASPVPRARALAALELVLKTMSPSELTIPENVLGLLLPRPPGQGGNRELFDGRSFPAFDALGAAATAARLAVAGLLNAERCTRVVDFHARSPQDRLSLEDMLDLLLVETFPDMAPDALNDQAILAVVQDVVVSELIRLASSTRAPERVRARVEHRLVLASERIDGQQQATTAAQGARAAVLLSQLNRINRFLSRDQAAQGAQTEVQEAPPGSPIGTGDLGCCSFGHL